jgi:diadenosine tetraphosphate (Ap4A) HIT family hydrolase
MNSASSQSPFSNNSGKHLLVCIKGKRPGYIQVASSKMVTEFKNLPNQALECAKAWAGELEKLGAKRVYWFILSEEVRHLHIHLYPRWNDEESRGITLFEKRFEEVCEPWSKVLAEKLEQWALKYDIESL